MSLYLVSCVSQKLSVPAPAADLYKSAWFRKARSYVAKSGGPWLILSAKYGLVHPDKVIEPYCVTLNTMPVAHRREWARNVLGDLESYLLGVETVVFLAGQRYREFLEGPLAAKGVKVGVPMAGLRIGEQLSWLEREVNG
jgi:hypothetical protein